MRAAVATSLLSLTLGLAVTGSIRTADREERSGEAVVESPVGAVGFTHVLDILPSDTALWVLSKDEPFLTHLPMESGMPTGLGRLGDGPAELRTPLSLAADPGGLKVIDPLAGRAIRVTPTLLVEPVPWEAKQPTMVRRLLAVLSPQSPFRTLGSDGGVITTRFTSPVRFPVEQSFGELVWLDSDGRRTLRSPELLAREPPGLAPFLSPVPLWDACGSWVVRFDGDSVLTWIAQDGRRLERSLDLDRARLDDSFVLDYFVEWARIESPSLDLATAAEAARRAARGRPRLTPPNGPAVIGFACVAGNAVLNLFDPEEPPHGRGSQWLVVPPSGPIRRATIAPGFRPLRSWANRLYGARRDAATGYDFVHVVTFATDHSLSSSMEQD